MNNKGFTLVELLAVIIVLGIIVSIAVSSYLSSYDKTKEKLLKTKIDNIELAAIEWAQENIKDISTGCSYQNYEGLKGYKPNFCLIKTVKDLVDSEYMKTDEYNETTNKKTLTNNVTGKTMFCDEVLIYRKNNRMYAVIYDVKSNNTNLICNEG